MRIVRTMPGEPRELGKTDESQGKLTSTYSQGRQQPFLCGVNLGPSATAPTDFWQLAIALIHCHLYASTRMSTLACA